MRRNVEFDAEGTTLRGWLYQPEGASPTVPIVVMAHGFSAVKEQLEQFALAFAESGFAVLLFDHRKFGASGGEPRQEIDPVAQARDYRHAITFARTLDRVNPDRIGVWGTSFSGGLVLAVAAVDRRVACVVAQVPTISGHLSGLRRMRPELVPALLARFDSDREARFRGEPPVMVPVVAEDPLAACALSGREAWTFFASSAKSAPSWRNEVTLRSLEMAREWEPGALTDRISPTPLLMIVATHDTLTPTDLALAAYERALQPKRLHLLRGGHFVAYEEGFGDASAAALNWFSEHLRPEGLTIRTD